MRYWPSLFLVFMNLAVRAQVPAGYYDPAAGLNGVQLQSALHAIIDNHSAQSYSSLWEYFESTDMKPDGSVWDIYSDNPGGNPPYLYHFTTADQCGNYSGEGDCFNREHSWPKSWFDDMMPMYTDLFHLYPTDGYVNNRRGNYPYGEVGTATWTSMNGSLVGNCVYPGYSGTVFEPIDAYKGDLARTYFYMAVRYYTEDSGWSGSEQTNGSQLKPWAMHMMLDWNEADPVSDKEIDRNNAVYGIQLNRNPFIDHPEYAQAIWDPSTGLADKNVNKNITVYPVPSVEFCIIDHRGYYNGEKTTIKLMDVAGRQFKISHTAYGSIIKVDVKSLTPGFYMIGISEDGKYPAFANIIK
ncbi:MAG TPA: endonuclease [Lentimicrobium sp.]|nr:endonuclease [Lentimicrobium sp.]